LDTKLVRKTNIPTSTLYVVVKNNGIALRFKRAVAQSRREAHSWVVA
jgi:hypothetical protein